LSRKLIQRHGGRLGPAGIWPSGHPGAPQEIRSAALALGGTAVLALVCLVVFFVVQGPFGAVNDLANAGIGWLVLVLAALVRRADRDGWQADGAVAAAAAGAAAMTWGSWLVITGRTGFHLAGLVSTLGVAAVGLWMLLAHAASGPAGVLRRGPARLGRLTGALMAVGVLALPGVLSGVDDLAEAPWHSVVAEAIAWLGAYVLLPTWCLRLAGPPRRR
jgi:hypothetical protein